MEIDYETVNVDEFDALAIELKLPCPLATKEAPVVPEASRKYPAKEHARKVAKQLGATHGFIYLPGQESQRYEDSDMAPEFRQRRYFYYLSGADFANCAVIYEIAHDLLILWIPYSDPRQVLWYGTTPDLSECLQRLDVDFVRYADGMNQYLYHRLKLDEPTALFVLRPDQTPDLNRPGAPKPGTVHIDSTHLRPAIDAARVTKTDYEIAMIRRANDVTSASHRAVLERLRHLTNERELEAIFRGTCMARGAKRQAYPVIAGSGPNASTLHYEDNDQALAGRQLVVLDAGCEWNCYASDVTRTLPLVLASGIRPGTGTGAGFGFPTPEAEAIYAAVERMQEECIARVRPGTAFRSLHRHACAVAVEELLRLGILRGGAAKAGEILARGTVAAFFPHGLGHHVGLEVHDVSGGEPLLGLMGDRAAAVGIPKGGYGHGPGTGARGKRREWVSAEMAAKLWREGGGVSAENEMSRGPGRRLETNMVVTIEPGIYFCRPYIEEYFLKNPVHARYIDKAVLERYYPVGGVRIEDDILVTVDGYENLTTAPKGKEALRIINAN